MEIQELKKKYLKYVDSNPDILSDFYMVASHVLNVTISAITPFIDIDEKRQKRIEKILDKHIKGEPIQKVLGYSIFYDCYIEYSPHVLTPRIETEMLVEKVIEHLKKSSGKKVLDLCTGSGCIAIAIAKNTDTKVFSVDISKKALKECKSNAQNNHVDIEVLRSDMFESLEEKYDVIVSNPPYIPVSEYNTLDKIVKNHDPRIALTDEGDGLKFYRIIAENAKKYLADGGKVFMEIGYNQGELVKDLMKKSFSNVEVIKDYSGNDRIVISY